MTAKELYYFNRHFNRLVARQERIFQPTRANSSNMVAALKEHCTFMLGERDQIKYDLIERYEDRCSAQLKYEKHKLYVKGKKQGESMLAALVNAPNPLLDMIKSEPWRGCRLPVPVRFGE